uniref:Uncharacterized protein n=1 Tax=Cacopsylla melanoneura TaxID=428564 RepID=A0A8D8YAY3_9HEMI
MKCTRVTMTPILTILSTLMATIHPCIFQKLNHPLQDPHPMVCLQGDLFLQWGFQDLPCQEVPTILIPEVHLALITLIPEVPHSLKEMVPDTNPLLILMIDLTILMMNTEDPLITDTMIREMTDPLKEDMMMMISTITDIPRNLPRKSLLRRSMILINFPRC